MVKKAIFLLEANDEDVTEKLKKNILWNKNISNF